MALLVVLSQTMLKEVLIMFGFLFQENKNDLRSIMMFIYEVEERSNYGKNLDMTYALTEIVKLEMFTSMWWVHTHTYSYTHSYTN